MNKKILVSLSVIGAVAAIAVGGTIAYFSDTETSTGNTFTAGEIDLTVDNTSYRSNNSGALVAQPGTTWAPKDLEGGDLFFNFADLKPGDLGEDTVSLHVNSNDAWLCASIDITANNDVTCTEPEEGDDPNCNENGSFNGELANELNFIFWADDGDNVLEVGETVITRGPASQVLNGVTYALADASANIWGVPGPMGAGQTKYIGKAWCFGDIDDEPLPQQNTGGPDVRGAGVTCNGSAVNNAAQSDNLMGNITFYAEQARNNPNFLCSGVRTRTLILEDKTSEWDVINNNTQGILTYETAGPEFKYTFEAKGLTPGSPYSLIYYADQQSRFADWGGDSPGALIGTFVADGFGNIPLAPAITTNLGMDLPAANDWNAVADPDYCDYHNLFDDYNLCTGAKIWLVPSSDYDSPTKKLTAWNPTTYLFETDLVIYSDTNN